MMKRWLYLLSLPALVFAACTAEDPATLDATKALLSFRLENIDSARMSVKMEGDTVFVEVPRNTDLAGLTPVLGYEGASMVPASGVARDFSSVVKYTVTAEDKSSKDYFVKVRLRDAVYIGGVTQLSALDTKDGSLLWRDDANGNFAYSNPLLHGDTLYAGSINGNMYAFDARTGRIIWKKWLAAVGIEGPAALSGNTLYVGTNDDDMFALDPKTGNTKWSYKTGSNISTKPLFYLNSVIFGSSDGYLYALEATTGKLIWRYFTQGMIVSSDPVISNNVVFIGSRNQYLHAVNATNGQAKWTYFAGVSMEHACAVVANGTVYAPGGYGAGNSRGSLYAIDEATGAGKWAALIGLGFSGSLSIHEGLLYVSANDGYFYAVDAVTSATKWRVQIAPNGAGATVKNGIVYVAGGGSGKIYAFDAVTGISKWNYAIPNDIFNSNPAVGRVKPGKGISVF